MRLYQQVLIQPHLYYLKNEIPEHSGFQQN